MLKVTAGVIFNNGLVLIAQRPKGKKLELKWEFPGGKIEEGESSEECLVRELQEELSIHTQIKRHIYTSTYMNDPFPVEVHAYEAVILKGDIALNDHEQVKWVELDDLDKYDFVPADIPIIQKIRELLNNSI